METTDLQQQIGELLRQRGLTLGTVESASGGLISHLITNVPGCSDYYLGSVVAYSNDVKTSLIGVKASAIMRYGAVSAVVARQMAEGGRKALNVDLCLSDTGIAGPGGATAGKPAGLFYIGLAWPGGVAARRRIFAGSREERKQRAAAAALRLLREHLMAEPGAV